MAEMVHEQEEKQLESHEEASTENGENQVEITTTEDDDTADLSPRGVLERSASSSEFDRITSLTSSIINHRLTKDDELLSSALSLPARVSFIQNLGNPMKSSKLKLGRSHASEDSIDWMMPKPSWRNFTLQELEAATKKFSPGQVIGKGGHAEVYKGCLPDGQIVAVKKIIKEDKKDEDKVQDFLSELGIIAHINHPNAAKLIGFGIDNGLYLVLQFAPNGSLGSLLHDGDSEDCFDWTSRFKVAVGIADGLKYLHYDCQKRIIHRDITASNILLMEDYQPQISDFGLAKWLPDQWLHITVSPIEGTFGYMAPEYFMHGITHEKTDVFAFGVLLLELVTGRHAVDSDQQISLVKWAKPHLENNDVKELADPRLGDVYDITTMERAILAASLCVDISPEMRPSMSKVVQLLSGESGEADMEQNSAVDASDKDGYNNATYLKDLDRHKELVMG
ncbi:receptor-like cytosolic serine/threonine-protein kinase RBK1 [Heracleum sosnowskyi]|uniref:non-specific serine/threonine protein kinase n=1 Tax=Heracleum sosnowskyi TaxID=360622 RepID=A0AAD8IVL7_9APIA|nr:receptor-like cytosolic serine/threonine-protein kinase RBK1 [Heracleum sosnowskyi]